MDPETVQNNVSFGLRQDKPEHKQCLDFIVEWEPATGMMSASDNPPKYQSDQKTKMSATVSTVLKRASTIQ
jgi:hypothetical protein